MRFYNQPHRFYCGVDLHARCMYLCVLDHASQTVLHRNYPADAAAFLEAVAPFRDGLAVAVECMFAWYWLADLCALHHIPFVLGHALYMKAIHHPGGQAGAHDLSDAAHPAGLRRSEILRQLTLQRLGLSVPHFFPAAAAAAWGDSSRGGEKMLGG